MQRTLFAKILCGFLIVRVSSISLNTLWGRTPGQVVFLWVSQGLREKGSIPFKPVPIHSFFSGGSGFVSIAGDQRAKGTQLILEQAASSCVS